LAAFALGLIRYGSVMNMTFHGAIYSFLTALIVGLLASRGEIRETQRRILVLDASIAFSAEALPIWCLSAALLTIAVVLNVYWR